MGDRPNTWSATIHGLPDRGTAEATWKVLLGDGSDVPPGITFSIAPDDPLASPPHSEGPLDAAWKEAEAALPLAGWLSDDGRWLIPSGVWSISIGHMDSGDGYSEPHVDGYFAVADMGHGKQIRGDIWSDPATALRALARRLSKGAAEQEEGNG